MKNPTSLLGHPHRVIYRGFCLRNDNKSVNSIYQIVMVTIDLNIQQKSDIVLLLIISVFYSVYLLVAPRLDRQKRTVGRHECRMASFRIHLADASHARP